VVAEADVILIENVRGEYKTSTKLKAVFIRTRLFNIRYPGVDNSITNL
jgi:hypothetical protein